MNFRARKAAPLEPDKIQADQPRAIAHRRPIRDHIRLNAAHAAKYRLAADAHKLMNGRAATDKNRIGDFHMPTQHDVIGQDHAIRQVAIMRDMRDHQVDMITIGQYLAPSGHHLPVRRYVHPDVFKMFEEKAYEMGFTHAAVGAMVRSSYHADEQAHGLV